MSKGERSESKDPEPVEGSKGLDIVSGGTYMAWFYILRLTSGGLYLGATEDLKQRYADHLKGIACRITSLDPPIDLLFSEEFDTFVDARKREAQVKRWSRAKKEALVRGVFRRLKSLARSHDWG